MDAKLMNSTTDPVALLPGLGPCGRCCCGPALLRAVFPLRGGVLLTIKRIDEAASV